MTTSTFNSINGHSWLSECRFLFNKTSADYQYYDSRVRALQAGTSAAYTLLSMPFIDPNPDETRY